MRLRSTILDSIYHLRAHGLLEITYLNGYFCLKDNNSRNHTYHNGKRVSESVLELGDGLRFANTEATFSVTGFDLMKSGITSGAIQSLESTLAINAEFISALRTLAFLLERDIARRSEAQAVWDKLKQLEKRN